jgi:hypothetical protein
MIDNPLDNLDTSGMSRALRNDDYAIPSSCMYRKAIVNFQACTISIVFELSLASIAVEFGLMPLSVLKPVAASASFCV